MSNCDKQDPNVRCRVVLSPSSFLLRRLFLIECLSFDRASSNNSNAARSSEIYKRWPRSMDDAVFAIETVVFSYLMSS